ncbi:MAG: transporter [Pseudonocardiales bacterium]|nr:transporter [Pseudonocardiales bacterium]
MSATRSLVVPSLATASWHRLKVEILVFRRTREALFFLVAFPPLMLFLFGAIFGSNKIGPPDHQITFAQYFVAGMVGTGVWGACFQYLGLSVPLERDSGALKRLVATPMPKAAYFLGKIGVVTLLAAAETLLLLIMGVLFYDLDLPPASHWVTFVWVFVLGCAACTLTGLALSGLLRNGQVASAVVTPIAIVLQFISGVYFVFSDLPPWLQWAGSLFPLRWLTLGLRSVFLPEGYESAEPGQSWNHLTTALVLIAWCVGGAVIAARTFTWMPNRTD